MMQNNFSQNLNLRRSVFDGIMFAYLSCVFLVTVLRPDEEAMLQLGRNASVFGILFLVGGIISHILNGTGRKSLGELIFQPAHKKAEESAPLLKSLWGWQLLIFNIVTLVVALIVTKSSLIELLDIDGFKGAMRLFGGLLSPNFEILPKAVLTMIETIFMAFLATALATPLAFVLCFFCSRNVMTSNSGFVIYSVLRMIFNISRSIEAVIWAIIFSVWVGIGPFAGMLALMIHSIASLAKQYSEAVESVSDGPIEGIEATGATKLQVVWFSIVPQVVLPFISFTIYRWDINIRMATIVGLVGGGGIGTLLMLYSGQAMWPEVGTIILVIAFVVWFMDQASAYVREALK